MTATTSYKTATAVNAKLQTLLLIETPMNLKALLLFMMSMKYVMSRGSTIRS